MSDNHYICVIGDVVGSRVLANDEARNQLQERLGKCLDQLNRNKNGLASPYTITLGDEFQAVFDDASRLFADFWFILHSVYPVKVRFSIGVGSLSTRINRERAIGMDGEAFYAARSGINELRKKGGLFRWSGGDASQSPLANPTLDLISHHSSTWKPNRLLVLHEMLRGNTNVDNIVRHTGLSKISTYKNIQAGALKTVVVLLNEICGLINKSINAAPNVAVPISTEHSPDNTDLALL